MFREMTITEMITRLEELKEKHGDLPVCSYYGWRQRIEPSFPLFNSRDGWYDPNEDCFKNDNFIFV